MSSSNRNSESSKFTELGVGEYERRRYRGIDQRIVHAREVHLIKRLFDAIRLAEGGRTDGPVLDLPCGYGRFTDFLRTRTSGIVNCDLSFEMVRRAGEKLGRPGVVANAKRGLPFKEGVFGAVFSVRFFHHVHDPADREAILREFRRVSSGWVILSFYRMNGLHVLQRRVRRMFNKSRANIKMIEPGLFEKETAAAGFELVRVWPLFRGLHAYHIALLRKK